MGNKVQDVNATNRETTMKRYISAILLLVVCTFAFSACKKKAPESAPVPTQKPRKADTNLNQEPVASRPFVLLTPRADGKAVTLSIQEMKKQATDAEYEVEYSAGSLLQGAFGTIDSLSTLPVNKEILLGSCSSGGKCTYNTGVTGGTMTLRFGNPDYSLKQEWSYIEKANKETTWNARDAKFSLDVSKAKNTASYVIVYNSPGYPGTPVGTVVAGPYAVAYAGTVTGNATVSIRLPQDVSTGTIASYDGKIWTELKTTVTDRQAVATGPVGQVYVVVTK